MSIKDDVIQSDPSSLLDGIGWKAQGNWKPIERRMPFIPRTKHLPALIPMAWRFLVESICGWWSGEGIFINILKQQYHLPHSGVPIGGIGCGSIGRDYRGGFNRFAVVPGMKEVWVNNVKANQFILIVRSKTGQLLTQRVLTCAPLRGRNLSTWNKSFDGSNVRYRGLFPRSWTEFSIPEYNLTLICEQISPVIPHDYKDSSLPVASFVWSVVNKSQTDYRVSITFTWQSGTGNDQWTKESVVGVQKVSDRNVEGMEMKHRIRGKRMTYGVYAKKDEGNTISMTSFDPKGDGRGIWRTLEEDGNFENYDRLLDGYRECAVAVCSETEVLPDKSNTMEFILVWHMPEIDFGVNSQLYLRRYTRYFNDESAALNIGSYAVQQREVWNKKIEEWQSPVINDRSLPEWYRSTLFNELYYVVDGSVSWLEYEDDNTFNPHTAKHLKEYGRFGYMESWEYLMINTYDVHFYASAAFIENWPQLEVAVQLEFSETIPTEDTRIHKTLMDGEYGIVKKSGRLPHDLGHPLQSAFEKTNAYFLHDTGEWKDLNLKFILSSLRDYELILKDNENAKAILTILFNRSMELIQEGFVEWDTDNDGMIENGGFADQTYDVWTMSGTSAYCGSLWLASLEAARRMAVMLNKTIEAEELESQLEQAKGVLIKKLWNGKYFNFDEVSTSIMADQLCGVWFMASMDGGKKNLLIDEKKVISSLDQIFENNVQRFREGRCGAANGMTHDGKLETSSIQSEEMWTGTTYALASFYALMGDRDRCFSVAEGVYNACWVRSGLQYQTPESIFERRFYRAIGYMRPLAIWNIHSALQAQAVDNLQQYEMGSISSSSSAN